MIIQCIHTYTRIYYALKDTVLQIKAFNTASKLKLKSSHYLHHSSAVSCLCYDMFRCIFSVGLKITNYKETAHSRTLPNSIFQLNIRLN